MTVVISSDLIKLDIMCIPSCFTDDPAAQTLLLDLILVQYYGNDQAEGIVY
jgi:hypothetical protein